MSRISRVNRISRDARDRGAGTLDYVGGIVIAAGMAVAVSLAMVNVQPGNTLARAACQIITLGQGSCGDDAPSKADREPSEPCVVGSDQSTKTLRAGFAVIGQGSERWLIEELGDGRYRLSRATGAGAGVTTGVGFDVSGVYNDQDYGVSLGAEANALAVGEEGEVYYVGSEDEAKKFLSEKRWDQGLDSTVGPSGPARWLVDKVRGEDKLPEPDERWVAGGVVADGKATVDWLALGAQAEADAAVMLGGRLRKDGSGTAYYSVSVSGQAAASTWSGDGQNGASKLYKAQAAGTVKGTIEVDYDAKGNATAMRLKGTFGGQAAAGSRLAGEDDLGGPSANKYSDVTYELPLNNAQDKQYAAGMAASVGIPFVPGVSTRPRSHLPSTENLADVVGFAGSVAEHGKMWQDDYDINLTTELGLNFDAELVTGLVVDAKSNSVVRTSKGQRYFDGTTWVDREGCSS